MKRDSVCLEASREEVISDLVKLAKVDPIWASRAIAAMSKAIVDGFEEFMRGKDEP